MWKYYTWAAAEKVLSKSPGGKSLYHAVGRVVKKDTTGTGDLKLSLRLLKRAKPLLGPDATAMEVGTGWFHRDAFLLYLAGDGPKIHLFDVEDKGQLNYVQNYVQNLMRSAPMLAAELDLDQGAIEEKIRPLLDMRSLEEIYAHCRFDKTITQDTGSPWLPEASVDVMFGTCVLNHIPPPILLPELIAMRTMLKPDGSMFHFLGHIDHWTHHDRSVNIFNYYRYSDRTYRRFFESLEYQNRMVEPEWRDMFGRAGLAIADWEREVTDASREALRTLPRIDTRYASVPEDELASRGSWVHLVRGTLVADATSSPAGRVSLGA